MAIGREGRRAAETQAVPEDEVLVEREGAAVGDGHVLRDAVAGAVDDGGPVPDVEGAEGVVSSVLADGPRSGRVDLIGGQRARGEIDDRPSVRVDVARRAVAVDVQGRGSVGGVLSCHVRVSDRRTLPHVQLGSGVHGGRSVGNEHVRGPDGHRGVVEIDRVGGDRLGAAGDRSAGKDLEVSRQGHVLLQGERARSRHHRLRRDGVARTVARRGVVEEVEVLDRIVPAALIQGAGPFDLQLVGRERPRVEIDHAPVVGVRVARHGHVRVGVDDAEVMGRQVSGERQRRIGVVGRGASAGARAGDVERAGRGGGGVGLHVAPGDDDVLPPRGEGGEADGEDRQRRADRRGPEASACGDDRRCKALSSRHRETPG